MGKFVKMFKGLPPEMRMMLMMVGLGSPVGAIYFLQRFFPHTPMWQIILYVGLAVAGIALLAFIISKIFGRGKKKRSNKMANELASDSTAGPSKVDASAAIKSNNEKFFKAVRDMRKEAHISVYDLPWYVVIGDSGCGKTFLVNNGGLTFSLGKPEGYQLGTLNYNWWFTEDAVFIDMAGRLCNPQDDGARRGGEAFPTAVSKGSRGFRKHNSSARNLCPARAAKRPAPTRLPKIGLGGTQDTFHFGECEVTVKHRSVNRGTVMPVVIHTTQNPVN